MGQATYPDNAQHMARSVDQTEMQSITRHYAEAHRSRQVQIKVTEAEWYMKWVKTMKKTNT